MRPLHQQRCAQPRPIPVRSYSAHFPDTPPAPLKATSLRLVVDLVPHALARDILLEQHGSGAEHSELRVSGFWESGEGGTGEVRKRTGGQTDRQTRQTGQQKHKHKHKHKHQHSPGRS